MSVHCWFKRIWSSMFVCVLWTRCSSTQFRFGSIFQLLQHWGEIKAICRQCLFVGFVRAVVVELNVVFVRACVRAFACARIYALSEAFMSVKVCTDKVYFHVLDNVQVGKQSHTWSVKTASIVKKTHPLNGFGDYFWTLSFYLRTKSTDSTEFHGVQYLK